MMEDWSSRPPRKIQRGRGTTRSRFTSTPSRPTARPHGLRIHGGGGGQHPLRQPVNGFPGQERCARKRLIPSPHAPRRRRLAAGQLVPAVTWFNTSTAWVDLDFDAPDPLTMVLPTDASGTADLRVELRTEANVSLVFEEDGTPLSSTRKRQPCLAAVRTRPPMPTSVPIGTSS